MDKEENIEGSITIEEAMKKYPQIFGDQRITNSLITHKIICRTNQGVVSEVELTELIKKMEGKRYVTMREISQRSGISKLNLEATRRKELIGECVTTIVSAKGNVNVKAIDEKTEDEMYKRLRMLSVGNRGRKGKDLEGKTFDEDYVIEASDKQNKYFPVADRKREGVLKVTKNNLRNIPDLGYEISSVSFDSTRKIIIQLSDSTDSKKTLEDVKSHFYQILTRNQKDYRINNCKFCIDGTQVVIEYAPSLKEVPTEVRRAFIMYTQLLDRERIRQTK